MGKKKFFNRWKSDMEFDKADEGMEEQHMLVESLQKTVEHAGSLQNRKLAVKTSLSSKRKQQQSLHRKTMAKVIAAFRRYRESYAFNKWR